MKRLIGIVVVLVIALAAVGVSLAATASHSSTQTLQTDAACAADSVAATITAAQDALAQAQTAAGKGNADAALAYAASARDQLGQLAESCGSGSLADALCTEYPQVCVPLVGGGTGDLASVEAPADRTLPASESGVVRGVMEDGTLFIGNPDAPIRIREYLDFACSHCIGYHESTVTPLIADAVVNGKASFEVGLLAFVAGDYSRDAAYAMLCAGEQGAAWEMHDALFAQVQKDGAGTAYTVDSLRAIADRLGLDSEALATCVQSGRYADALAASDQSANDLGVTGTPTVLVNTGDGWSTVDNRTLDNLMTLIDQAQ